MSTTTQEVINKGLALLKTAKQKADYAVNDYITVPGFKDYEVNSKNVLRSKKTGNVQQIPAGKKKYLIFATNGQRKSIGVEDINKLIERTPQPAHTSKMAKMKGEKTVKAKDLIVAEYNKGITDYKSIATTLNIKSNTVYIAIKVHRITTMFKAGKTPAQIANELGTHPHAVENFISRNKLK